MDVQKEKVLEALNSDKCTYFYQNSEANMQAIPGMPIAFWLGEQAVKPYGYTLDMSKYISPMIGMVTGDTNRFLRFWQEVDFTNIGFNCVSEEESVESGRMWFPYQKGGNYRRWYGNNEYVVNWKNAGYEIKYDNFMGKRVRSHNYNGKQAFKGALTWSSITSSRFSARIVSDGFLYDVAGPFCQVEEKNRKCLLAFIISNVADLYLNAINPTINFVPGTLLALPLDKKVITSPYFEEINSFAENCIRLTTDDWDSFETSWDFTKHPLLSYEADNVSTAFEMWSKECDERFNQLKANEEELNRIFIDIYELQDELKPEVEDKDITVRKADLQRDIKSLILYAVGCMFGRYSLDEDGLAYAGGEWDNSKYDTFIPDEDNCIPITDEEYFEDDIVGLFCAWLKKVYGEDTLEENLDFIANALDNKGKTSREVIRNYFLTDFIKDHIKTYQKRPIYWLFDSGKQNGFKALVYMHRWNADTIGNVRVEYLHRMQRVYEKEINRMQEIIDNSHDNKEISNATKRKEKLQKQIKETKDYDAKIAHLALSRIDIDLDDGVKVNYEKVQTADGKKMQILAKI